MPAWPATLPQQLLVSGYDESPPDLALRTAMSTGPAKLRRRSTADVRPIGGAMVMTTAQVATLETFYVTTLVSGTLSFTHDHPRTAVSSTFRFTAPPGYEALGAGEYHVTLGLEITP